MSKCSIPKNKIQEQMEYFFRQGENKGAAGMILAWFLLKDWVDTYDVPAEEEKCQKSA